MPAAAPLNSQPLAPIAQWLEKHVVSRLRADLKAVYRPPTAVGGKGAYRPAHQPVTLEDLEQHVLNAKPIGCYVMAPATDGWVKAAVVDLDDKKNEFTWAQLCGFARAISAGLEGHGLLPFAVRSGSGHGLHLWLLWQGPQEAVAVRQRLAHVLQGAGVQCHVDIFPAQDSLNGGLGNLVALPFSRASRPVSLLTEAVVEDLSRWQLVEPGLSRGLPPTGTGPRTSSQLSLETLAGDAGRGLQLVKTDDQYGPVDPAYLAEALGHVAADDYQRWMKYGLAIKGAVEDGQLAEADGFRLWDEWAKSCGEKYNERAQDAEWRRFRPRDGSGAVTLGTIWHEAKAAGWKPTKDAVVIPIKPSPALKIVANNDKNNGPKKISKKNTTYYQGLLRWKDGGGGHDIQTINEDHFQAYDGGKLFIFKEKWDSALKRHCLERRSVRDFRDANRQQVQVGANARGVPIFRALGDAWLESLDRRRYEEVVFQPKGCDEWQYNLWQGWEIQPSETGSWTLFRDHVLRNICRHDQVAFDYILKWLAYTAQHLDETIGTALVLRGNKGTGKGFFVKKIGKLFGQNFMQVSSSKAVTGSFNSHLRDCVLLFADEAFCTGQASDEARLNALITEETIAIEGKGRDVVACRNMLHIILATNKDWAVPATADERRFCCVNVGDEKQQDKEYFDNIEAELNDGGCGRLLWDLLHMDLSGWDPRRVPSTDELTEQKLQNLPMDGKWWFHRLAEGSLTEGTDSWSSEIPAYELFDDYLAFCDKQKNYREVRIGSQEHLIKAISKMIDGAGKVLAKKKRVPGRVGSFEAPRPMVKTVWDFPELGACRTAFTAWQRIKIDWDAISGIYIAAIDATKSLENNEELEF